MSWANRLVLVAFLLLLPHAARAQVQTGRVTGTVTDSSTGQPVTGANVLIVGTRFGARPRVSDGRFVVSGVPVGPQQVRVQRIGFTPQTTTVTVVADQATGVSFQLKPQSVQLDAVVSVGYGAQSKRDVTGAVSSVTTEAIDKAPIATVDQMLQGTSAGVGRVHDGVARSPAARCIDPRPWCVRYRSTWATPSRSASSTASRSRMTSRARRPAAAAARARLLRIRS